jgi:putative membrane protein
MMADLILAIAHHLLAFSLLGILFAQYAIVRPGLAGVALSRVRMFDRF